MKRKAPDGWLVTPLFAGFFTQVVLIGAYLIALDPAYRTRLFGEIAFVPQPFVAGATAGVVFWLTLHWANATPSDLDRVGQ